MTLSGFVVKKLRMELGGTCHIYVKLCHREQLTLCPQF